MLHEYLSDGGFWVGLILGAAIAVGLMALASLLHDIHEDEPTPDEHALLGMHGKSKMIVCTKEDLADPEFIERFYRGDHGA